MGTLTLWDRIRPWLRHPLISAEAAIAWRYCEKRDLEMHYRGQRVN